MALIGQPSPDDIWELTADLLERVTWLQRENRDLREDHDHYRNEISRLRSQRKATA